jgi:exosortase C (VPDSG-CTERM-specific)
MSNARTSSTATGTKIPELPRQTRIFGFVLIILSILSLRPLFNLAALVLSDSLYSHIPLIPLVSAYLIWLKRHEIATPPGPATAVSKAVIRWPAFLPAIPATVALVVWFLARPEWRAEPVNSASLLVLAYVCFIWTASLAVFGWDVVRHVLFPLAFLVFIVPFPGDLTRQIESFFQYASAEAASLLLAMSQTPVLREGLLFSLPGITLEVAQECSGIRSTLVLFITSLVGGYMFFELRRYRAILAFVVIPIAIFRNGFRIFTIAMLCVHVSPEMIDSVIHRRGGPLFFVLSLVPFFALLIFLYRRERKLRLRALPNLG